MGPEPRPGPEPSLAETVARKARRRRRGERQRAHPVWFWFGMFGLVGWSVSVPTVAGVLLGWWIDREFPGDVSWTLNLLVVGLVLGCLNAWRWLSREGAVGRRADTEEDDGDEP